MTQLSFLLEQPAPVQDIELRCTISGCNQTAASDARGVWMCGHHRHLAGNYRPDLERCLKTFFECKETAPYRSRQGNRRALVSLKMQCVQKICEARHRVELIERSSWQPTAPPALDRIDIPSGVYFDFKPRLPPVERTEEEIATMRLKPAAKAIARLPDFEAKRLAVNAWQRTHRRADGYRLMEIATYRQRQLYG